MQSCGMTSYESDCPGKTSGVIELAYLATAASFVNNQCTVSFGPFFGPFIKRLLYRTRRFHGGGAAKG